MLKKALPAIPNLKSLRAMAFTILGLSYIHGNNEESNYAVAIKRLAEKLVRRYNKTIEQNPGWVWFEDCLTYSNYKLPEALFRAYRVTGNKDYLRIAERTLKFLTDTTYEKEFFSPSDKTAGIFPAASAHISTSSRKTRPARSKHTPLPFRQPIKKLTRTWLSVLSNGF